MSYRPKSTYQILKSSGDEYKTLEGEPYKGSYILTSEGAFMGKDITKIGPPLIKIGNKKPPRTNNILETPNVNKYYRLNPGTVRFIQSTKPIVSTKTKPTKKDYQKGFYVRYFAKKTNSLVDYYEIDKKTYTSIKSKNPQYDFYSFKVDKLIWALEGDVIKANKSILSQKERTNPNVSSLFRNLSEFINTNKSKKENLNLSKVTTKEQLRGFIHHPEIDVVPYSPPKLIQEALNELEENNIIISPPLNTPPPSTPSTGGSTSGGGGGGY